jgi:hypothetical protein
MKKTSSGDSMRFHCLSLSSGLLLFVLGGPALAQSAGTATPEREPVRSLEQKTERIVHQDAGSRIEELRVGGQTRTIEVQTNSRVPGYQVQPLNPAQSADGPGSTGKSSWRVLNF